LEVGNLSGRHSAPQVDAANHAASLVVTARRPAPYPQAGPLPGVMPKWMP
jgi:hypothetical protein